MTELELEVHDGDITVWLPRTSFAVTYYKPKKSCHLLAKWIVARAKDHTKLAGAG